MKKNILFFILGLIVMGGIGTVAYSYTAKQVGFTPNDKSWKVKTVDEALTDLRENGTEDKICELKSGEALEIGSMYECDPGDGTKRNFYVLEVRANGVDLIMEKNISSGTMTWNNAMKYIESNGLKTSWKDVLDVDLPGAQQIANAVDNSSWKAIDSASTWWCLGSHKQDQPSGPLYCPSSDAQKKYAWLFNYTRGCESRGCTTEYSDTDGYPYGYWTRDAVNETTTARAWGVNRRGNLSNFDVSSTTFHGVRPVITISKNNIK